MKKRGNLIRYIIILSIIFLGILIPRTNISAYTDEQINQAKAWLSAHGYSPTRDGAYQAWSDYQNGKLTLSDKEQELVDKSGNKAKKPDDKKKKKSQKKTKKSSKKDKKKKNTVTTVDKEKEKVIATSIPPSISPSISPTVSPIISPTDSPTDKPVSDNSFDEKIIKDSVKDTSQPDTQTVNIVLCVLGVVALVGALVLGLRRRKGV